MWEENEFNKLKDGCGCDKMSPKVMRKVSKHVYNQSFLADIIPTCNSNFQGKRQRTFL